MSQVTSVNGANSALQSTTRSIEDQLGLDDFLNILVAELQNQNPLEPMDNTEMTSQIAQFSMLDGISSLQSSISEMKSLEMIGKDVIAFDPVSGSYVQGIVGGIIRQNGEIYLNVGGSYVSFENIMQVKAIDDLYGGNNGGFGSGLSAEGLETAASIIDFARQFLGYPYVLGAESPEDGFDCSGFTQYVYGKFGYPLRRSAQAQGYSEQGTKINRIEDLELGDLVYFNTVDDQDLSDHVGIYIGNNEFIHASTTDYTVKISSLDSAFYKSAFSWAIRVLE